jgi:hypothetical protein
MLWLPISANVLNLEMRVQGPTIGSRFGYSLKGNGDVEIMTTGAAWTEIVTIQGGLYVGNPLFFLVKIIVDLKNNKYVSARLNDMLIDLSEFSPASMPVVPLSRIDMIFRAFDESGAQTPIRIDDFIVSLGD